MILYLLLAYLTIQLIVVIRGKDTVLMVIAIAGLVAAALYAFGVIPLPVRIT